MATMYPGIGRPLYQATYNGTEPPQASSTAVIAAGEFSDCEPLNDSRATTISVTFNVAPTATTEIQFASDPTFANYFVIDVLPISADTFAQWTTLERLMGFIRIEDTSTKQIDSVFIQKEGASWG